MSDEFIDFQMIDPAGNKTLVVTSKQVNKSEIASILLNIFNVEQLGFLSIPSSGVPTFSMMGEEFSGNGIASAGLVVSRLRNVDRFQIKINNVAGKIAHIKIIESNLPEYIVEVRTQLRYEIEHIKSDISIVNLFDIKHIVLNYDSMSPPNIRDAQLLIKEYREPADKAIGVMYFNQIDDTLYPFVFVPSVHTFVKENACSSGSLAVVLRNSVINRVTDTVNEVVQPSSKKLRVKIHETRNGIVDFSLTIPTMFLGNGSINLQEIQENEY